MKRSKRQNERDGCGCFEEIGYGIVFHAKPSCPIHGDGEKTAWARVVFAIFLAVLIYAAVAAAVLLIVRRYDRCASPSRQMLEHVLRDEATPEPKTVTAFVNGAEVECPERVGGLAFKVIAGFPCSHVVYRESPDGPSKDEYFHDVDTIILRDGDQFVICPDGNPK